MLRQKTVRQVLSESVEQLEATDIPTARLDTEVMLAFVLGKNREWLAAHSDEELSDKQISKFEKLIKRRLKHEPVAYIVGKKEFYGRDFIVSPAVLVPRPETEDLIELSLEAIDKARTDFAIHLQPESALLRTQGKPGAKPWSKGECEPYSILDVGCGSGCVGLTLKLERPETNITLSDISPDALEIAKQNAANLKAEVNFIESDLLTAIEECYDLIVANLPYVDKTWETPPELDFEPSNALYAENGGLDLIFRLITQAPDKLIGNGYLLLEADPVQRKEIIQFAKQHGLDWAATKGYTLSFVNR